MNTLDYIQSTGTQYIDTGIKENLAYMFEMEYSPVSLVESYQSYLGGTLDNFTVGAMQSLTVNYIRHRGSEVARPTLVANEKNTLSLKDGKVSLNGTQIATVSTANPLSTASANNICVFCNGSLSRKSAMKLYSLKLYDSSGNLLRDLVPAKDGNTVCMYDNVSQAYFYNAGSGDFGRGAIIDPELGFVDLYQKVQYNNASGASTYTASSAERLLAISAETYNIGGSGSGSAANISSTGTVVSTDSRSTSASGDNRNSAFRASIIDVDANDTVTMSNRPYTTYAGQMHLVFNAETLATITNVAYAAYVDVTNDHKYQYTAQNDCILLCYCWNEDNYNQATDASISHSGDYSILYENKWQETQSTLVVGLYDVKAGDTITLECGTTATAYGTQMYAIYDVTFSVGGDKYLIESGGDYYTISGGVLTNVGSTLNAQLFADYGLGEIPDWSDYSSLPNPSVLCWSSDDFVDMVATTEGLPSPQIVTSAGISLIQPNTDGIDSVSIVDSGSPTYAFSVDDGTTWKIWSGSAWVTSSGTDMSGADVEALTKEEWDLLTEGETFIKVRFTLTADTDTVESITITYAIA